jgi:hypothetical protein
MEALGGRGVGAIALLPFVACMAVVGELYFTCGNTKPHKKQLYKQRVWKTFVTGRNYN